MARACFRCLFCGFESCESMGEVCPKCGHKIGLSNKLINAKAKIMQIISELSEPEKIMILRFMEEEIIGDRYDSR